MYKIKTFYLFLFTNILMLSNAWSCTLDRLYFGSPSSQVLDQYNIDEFEADDEGEYIISISGKELCNKLPDISIVEFKFIDNTFVSLSIKNPAVSTDLYEFAVTKLGKLENSKLKKDSDGKVVSAYWQEDKSMDSIYVSMGGYESLGFISKMHGELFDKILRLQAKAHNAYAEELNSRSTTSTISDMINNSTSNSDGNVDVNNNSSDLRDLEKKYNERNEKWQKGNKEIYKGR